MTIYQLSLDIETPQVIPDRGSAQEVVAAVTVWAGNNHIQIAPSYRAWLGKAIKKAFQTYSPETVWLAAGRVAAKGLNPSMLDSECLRVQTEAVPLLSVEETRELIETARDRLRVETWWWKKNASFYARQIAREITSMRAHGASYDDLITYIRSRSREPLTQNPMQYPDARGEARE